jgi:peroxiredoxin
MNGGNTVMANRFWKNSSTLALWAVLLALAAANVLLIRQNFQLRAALSRYEPEAVQPGDKLPSFSAKGAADEPLYIAYDGRGPRRVFFYFTPTCPYCRQQFAHWQEVLSKADRERFEVWGLVSNAEDRGRMDEYLRSVGCGTDSATPLRVAYVAGDILRSYKLTSTPTTLVVANDGTVERSWLGKWNAQTVSNASVALGLNLQTP